MIGDIVRLEGAEFRVQHVRCPKGLVHAVLRINSDRLHAPHHQDDGGVRDAEWTDEQVLTCFTCINHVWRNTPSRDRFIDVDDDDYGIGDADDDD